MIDTRLMVDDCSEGYVDPNFHAQYRGIVGSLAFEKYTRYTVVSSWSL